MSMFIMQLSPFDCSHRSGVGGTPEILIPHAAMRFFPPISLTTRQYPDVYFDVLLNTPTGSTINRYRLWYYEYRASGKKIDENRLRMDHATIDLTTPGGGDLLVISERPNGSNPEYEVSIIAQTDPSFTYHLGLCTQVSQDKVWGIV